jgi:hypothetical protein
VNLCRVLCSGMRARGLPAIVALLALALFPSTGRAQGVVINEVMAQNSHTLADDSGEYGDWIELYNPTTHAVDVGGLYLTDSLDSPTLWQIPTGRSALTTLAPGGYLLVWADKGTTGSRLHAGFQLSSSGDAVGLFDKDGTTLIDSVEFPSQRTDVSFGRDPDGGSQWRYFASPTPGSRNSVAFQGVVGEVVLSHSRGFFDSPFSLEMTCPTPEALIIYTLDGSVPCDLAGRFSSTAKVYAGPLAVITTTCVRVVAYRAGWMPSRVQTCTFLFLNDVIRLSQSAALAAGYPVMWGGYPADYEMDPEVVDHPDYSAQMKDAMLSVPTLSVVTDRANLFDPSTGIYANPLSEATSANPLQWERPISMELFQSDGLKDLQIDAGLRVQGGHSRHLEKSPKHSFGLRFRGGYGQTSLDLDLFEGSPVHSFDALQLRAGFNNAWSHWDSSQRSRAQYARDHWARDSLIEMGNPDALHGFSVHLYLNGLYWGLYMLHERPSASHYAAYNGGDADSIDAINGDPTYVISDPLNTGQVSDGTIDAWRELKTIVAGGNWEQIQKIIDVDNFIDWMILNYYGGNVDLKQGTNWRAAGGGPQRRPWRFYIWDGERILENVNETTVGVSDATSLYNALRGIEEFRVRFGDRVHKHLFNGGALTPEKAAQRYAKRCTEVELAVIAESARWGDYRKDLPSQYQYGSGPYDLYTKNQYWIPERDRLLNTYFPARTALVVNLFRNFKPLPLYPSVGAPVYNVNGTYRHGGHVTSSDLLSMTFPQGTTGKIYYTLDGSDPRVPTPSTPSGTAITLVAASAAKRVLVPTAASSDAWKGGQAFDDSAWTSVTGSPGGVGFDLSPTGGGDYRPYISCDLTSSMSGKNGSCFIRIPFTVSAADLGSITSLALKMLYDDGFVAYLNGVELYRTAFTGTPAWNSRANSSRDAGTTPTSFDVTGLLGELRSGDNLLAIQGMNSSNNSNDLLISVELVATQSSGPVASGLASGVLEYKGPIALARSADVKARVQSGSAWSAVNEAVYGVGPVASSLRVSEIMYHPQDTGNPDDPNTEFIELTNVGSAAINLSLVRFTKGIDFTFGDVVLQAHAFVVVVRDARAFAAKYGSGVAQAGVYAGSLDNAGERIRLEDATGEEIQDFEYKDGWYKSTDGQGYSLVVKAPETADPATLSDKAQWRASLGLGGSPGRGE